MSAMSRIVPNHVCVVVNMMDEVVMVRGDDHRHAAGGGAGQVAVT
jgi:D-serine deaminase-like pyridoxal phosphate-dependent protein